VCLEFGYILMRENNVFKELNWFDFFYWQ
jgi:hypothetical protein